MEDSNEVIGGPYEPLHQSVSLSRVPEVAGTLTNDAVGPVSASWRSVEGSVRGMLAAPLLHRLPERGLLDAQGPGICGCVPCLPAAAPPQSGRIDVQPHSGRQFDGVHEPLRVGTARHVDVDPLRTEQVTRVVRPVLVGPAELADRVPPAFSTRHGFGIVWFAIACPTGTG